MAFLFKSKKNQDRALASRDGPPSVGSSMQSAAARVREEKGSRSTPTGSLNSIDNEGGMGSPDQNYARQRGQSLETQQPGPPAQQLSQQPSDLPVSAPFLGPSPRRAALLTMLIHDAVSQWPRPAAAADKPQRFAISLVAAEINVYLDAPESLSSIWRRRECNLVQGGRHLRHGGPH